MRTFWTVHLSLRRSVCRDDRGGHGWTHVWLIPGSAMCSVSCKLFALKQLILYYRPSPRTVSSCILCSEPTHTNTHTHTHTPQPSPAFYDQNLLHTHMDAHTHTHTHTHTDCLLHFMIRTCIHTNTHTHTHTHTHTNLILHFMIRTYTHTHTHTHTHTAFLTDWGKSHSVSYPWISCVIIMYSLKKFFLNWKRKRKKGVGGRRLPSSGRRSNSQLHSGKKNAGWNKLNYFNLAGDFLSPEGFFSFLATSGAKWVPCAFKGRSASANFAIVVSHRLGREGKR